MPDSDIQVDDFMGAVLVKANDKAEQTHRWWFDRTDEGRLVFCAEVIAYTEDYSFMTETGGRHYVPENEMDVPDKVRDALQDEGFDTDIVDKNGRRL